MKTKLIVILGPTAVGKTALGIELAQALNGEVISGDSQQVYRQLDIGTAKVSAAEQKRVPHHLIDVRDVAQTYSAYDFVQEAQEAIADILGRGKLPIIVGGTGLYLQSLLEGYHLGGQVNQEQMLAYREELEGLSDQDLKTLAEQAQINVDYHNRRRLIRHLELEGFGQAMVNDAPIYDYLLIGLDDDRQRLYERINHRVDTMVEMGLLEEARWLYDNHPDVQARQGIGYKELFPYFSGQISQEEALEKIKQNSRRFAKRQLTWFRNRMNVDFYQVSEPEYKDKLKQAIVSFLCD